MNAPARGFMLKITAAAGLTLFTMLAMGTAGDPGGNEIPDGKRQLELRLMLHSKCTACHGPELQGGGAAPPLTARTLSGRDEQAIVDRLLNGNDGTAMPRWGLVLSRNEALWLVRFLRSDNRRIAQHY